MSNVLKRLRDLKKRLQKKTASASSNQSISMDSSEVIATGTNSVVVGGRTVVINGKTVSFEEETPPSEEVWKVEHRDLAPFTGVVNRLMGSVRIQLVAAKDPPHNSETSLYRESPSEDAQGSFFMVTLSGDARILPHVLTEVRGGQLELKMGPGSHFMRHPLVVHVTTPDLTSLTHTGHGSIKVHGVDGPRLELVHSGMGDVAIEGSVQVLCVRHTGQGDLTMGPLQDTREVQISHSGQGDLTMSGSTKELRVSMTGQGDLHCKLLSAQKTEATLSGMGDVWLNTKCLLGSHRGQGDVVVWGCTRSSAGFHSTGLGDIRYL